MGGAIKIQKESVAIKNERICNQFSLILKSKSPNSSPDNTLEATKTAIRRFSPSFFHLFC